MICRGRFAVSTCHPLSHLLLLVVYDENWNCYVVAAAFCCWKASDGLCDFNDASLYLTDIYVSGCVALRKKIYIVSEAVEKWLSCNQAQRQQ